jgi:hypothetical protein
LSDLSAAASADNEGVLQREQSIFYGGQAVRGILGLAHGGSKPRALDLRCASLRSSCRPLVSGLLVPHLARDQLSSCHPYAGFLRLAIFALTIDRWQSFRRLRLRFLEMT